MVDAWAALEDELADLQYSVAVLDVALDGTALLVHLHQLVTLHPRTHFVVCTAHPDPILVRRALLAGAAAVVGHDVTGDQLCDALSALTQGMPWPEGLGFPAVRHTGRTPPVRALTPRLRQIEQLLWDGMTYAQIADQLALSPKTIEAEVGKLRRAHGVPAFAPAPWEKGRRGGKRGGG
jgi:DNA-binding NarL/FixJ family response regulator